MRPSSEYRRGEWAFATDSTGASEITIDGQTAAAWYGDHPAAGDWSHSGTIDLAPGWHYFNYYHETTTGHPNAARAGFKRPGDSDWSLVSAGNLNLKPVNMDDGILLVTKRNTWSAIPGDHVQLVQYVETDAVKEAGWFDASIVNEINQDQRPGSGLSEGEARRTG